MSDEAIDFDNKILQIETIKLIKNSKGYTWEVRVFIKSGDDTTAISRLDKINGELTARYGAIQ